MQPVLDVEVPPLVLVDVGLLAGVLVLVGVLEELLGALGVAVLEQVLAQLQELLVDVVVHGEVAGVHDAYRKGTVIKSHSYFVRRFIRSENNLSDLG